MEEYEHSLTDPGTTAENFLNFFIPERRDHKKTKLQIKVLAQLSSHLTVTLWHSVRKTQKLGIRSLQLSLVNSTTTQ